MKKSTFLSLWEDLHPTPAGDGNSPLQGSGIESKAMHAIKTGLNLRAKKECGNFWDDFLTVLNNRDGMAELLEVRPDQLSRWTSKIREMLDKAQKAEAESSDKKSMIPTGEAPAGAPSNM
jgi:hypothetical protein